MLFYVHGQPEAICLCGILSIQRPCIFVQFKFYKVMYLFSTSFVLQESKMTTIVQTDIV